MTQSEIGGCIADRFDRWGRFLAEQQATPTIVVGLGHPGPLRDRFELIVTCPQGMPEEQMVQALQSALALLRRGRIHIV
jgi:hypothetical protein